ncbi:MAG TPA: phosphatase PAP2 family protein, partial [Chthoniobacterales bacterium]
MAGTKGIGLILLIGIFFQLSANAITNPFGVDPYPPNEVTTPEAPSNAPVTKPGQSATNPLPPFTSPIEDLFERNYWYLVLLDTKEVFTAPRHWGSSDWLTLGAVSAGIGTVMVFDEDINHAIRHARTDTLTNILDNVQPLGNEYAIGIVGTFYIYGEVFKDPRAKATALDSIAATAIGPGIIVNATKYLVGRARPTDGKGAYDFEPFSGHDSFLSGHTTEAFTLASVITEHYDATWVKVTAYGLAGTVGYARLNNNRHWPSDVLAGAAVGIFVGKTVSIYNRGHRRLKLQPIVAPNL